MKLTEHEKYRIDTIREQGKTTYKVLIISDLHGILCDFKAYGVVINMLQWNYFDEIIINGDWFDLPYISRHGRHLKLLDSDFFGDTYTEVKEIKLCRELLDILRKTTNAKIRYRLGNHCERLLGLKSFSKEQFERLKEIELHFKCLSSNIPKLLDFDKYDIIYDPAPRTNLFGVFDLIHGGSLARGAPLKNIQTSLISGSSGDTHRLNSTYIHTARGALMWIESGHLRLKENVEYLRTAQVPDWQQGFATVTFDLSKKETLFFGKTHPIIENKTEYNGVIYESIDIFK